MRMLLLFVHWECCYHLGSGNAAVVCVLGMLLYGSENAAVNCALGMIFLFVYCECCFLCIGNAVVICIMGMLLFVYWE